MDSTQLIFMLAVGSVAGFGFLYKGVVNYRRRAMIVDIPRSTIASLAMGLVEIHGSVKDAFETDCLYTPFSQTKCVHYSYQIDELRKSGKNSRRWVNIARDRQDVRFLASDETGEVVVDPSEAEVNLEIYCEYKHDPGAFGGFSRFLERLSNWDAKTDVIGSMPVSELKRVDSGGWNWYSIGDRRIREYCLVPGQRLFLIGTAKSDPERTGEALIGKGDNNPMYFIGDKSEKEMLSSLKWKIVAQLGIGVVLLAGVTYMLFG